MTKKKCSCNAYYTCKGCRVSDRATYQTIADELGITHQSVYEIEKKALRKLRENLNLLGYTKLEEVL